MVGKRATEEDFRVRPYRARYTANGSGWKVTSGSKGGRLMATARSLDSARREIVGLLAAATGQPAQFIPVEDQIDLPPDVEQLVRDAQAARRRAARAADELQTATEQAVVGLAESGLSLRDSGYVLGISHARVQQIHNQTEKGSR